MRTPVALLLLLASLAAFPPRAVSADALVWTYQYLLATAKTERELAPVTEHIIRDELPDNEITDVVAEVLLAHLDDASYPVRNKVRLLQVLAKARSRRYDALLAQVRAQSKDDPVRGWALAAKRRYFRADEPEYVPGTFDLAGFLRDIESAALTAHPTTAQGEHLSRFTGGSIEELFEWAGRPHHVTSLQTRVSDGIIDVKIQRIAFYYRGLGRVVFGYRKVDGDWMFQAVVADPLAFENEMPYRARAAELGLPDPGALGMQQLLSQYTSAMKVAVERNQRVANPPLEFMDTAAEILVRESSTANDPVTIDMYAWICRLLAERGGQRYAAVLQSVAAQAVDSKVARFARMDVEPAPDVPAAPYVPGTISLSAQRAKYASQYPDSTFQGGRL